MGRIMNHDGVRSSARSSNCQDRIAATLINTIGGRAPLDQGQVDSELGAAARGIGLVIAGRARARRSRTPTRTHLTPLGATPAGNRWKRQGPWSKELSSTLIVRVLLA